MNILIKFQKIGASIFSFAEDGHVFSLFFNEKKFKKENKKQSTR